MAVDNYETYKQIFPKGRTFRNVKMLSNTYIKEKSSVLQLHTWY